VPRLEKNPNVSILVTDPRGSQGILRPNHLHPPFNNKKARQALLHLVDQPSYLQATIGNPRFYKSCPAVFMCGGMPYESAAAAPKADLERARQLLKEGGYDGRPIVVLDPSDSPFAHAPALVTAERLKMIGAAVDLQSMDWSTMVSRRANKGAAVLGGAGEKSWFGWPTSEAMEKLRTDFTRQPDPARRKQIAEQVQQLTYDDVPYVPWGQFVIPSIFRKNVQGVLQFGATLLWNIAV
jgi:peptide/nickel transport system substrate-binding protein